MKTRNIRWMMWLLMMAMVVSASAQKNVLKAFDKMENAKEVVVKKVSNKTNDLRMPGRWRCNVQEFHIPKAEVARKHIARIDEAFSKDSKKEDVTYYTRMYALGENPTDKEKEAYKKILVRCDDTSEEIVIGSDPLYHVIVMRCQSPTSAALRTVVALEWKREPGYGYSVRIYEIEGTVASLKEEPFFHWNTYWRPVKTESRKDDITIRMHFYRDTYNGEDNSENSALLLNMTEYLNKHWNKTSEAEQKMVLAILQEMYDRSKARMHRDLIDQCFQTLKNGKGTDNEAVKRVKLYVDDYKACSTTYNKGQVLDDLKSYIRKLKQKGINENTSNDVYEHLVELRRIASTSYHQGVISDIVRILQK